MSDAGQGRFVMIAQCLDPQGAMFALHAAIREVVAERFTAAPPLLVAPAGNDAMRPAPLVVALHGHGGRADDYPVLWRSAAARAGAVLVIPQGVRRAGSGHSFPRDTVHELSKALRFALGGSAPKSQPQRAATGAD